MAKKRRSISRDINLQSPMLQEALVQARKGPAAVPSARGRAAIQSFAEAEGRRLGALDRATAAREAMAEAHAGRMELGRGRLDIARTELAEGWRALRARKRGLWAAAPIQAITTGLAFTDARKEREAAALQREQNISVARDLYQETLRREGPEAAHALSRKLPSYFPVEPTMMPSGRAFAMGTTMAPSDLRARR